MGEESKTKRYSDKRKEERLKREREKAEKKKRDDGIVTIIDVEDESSKDDVTEGLAEAIAELDIKGAAAPDPESNDVPPQVEKEKKVKKSYRERREERERRNERKEAADEESKERRKAQTERKEKGIVRKE